MKNLIKKKKQNGKTFSLPANGEEGRKVVEKAMEELGYSSERYEITLKDGDKTVIVDIF